MPDTGPSPHLSWAELACKDGTPYPVEWRDNRAIVLGQAFEAVREAVGAPIVIGSAYRTLSHNKAVGGARGSQHVEGRALDLYPPSGMGIDEFYARIKPVALDPHTSIHGLGKYPRFVHIDVRPQGAVNRCFCWQGSRAWAELKA